MPHAIWTGSINFGLVTIPVKLFAAVRDAAAGVHFNFLHDEDNGKIHNERVCDACGRKVAWEHVARGYETQKGEYVTVTDEEIESASPEATQSIDIVEFVTKEEVDPMLLDRPYYLQSEKRGRHAYSLLRQALAESGKIGIARVVLRAREHLAALEPHGDALVLATLRWAEEIAPAPPNELSKNDKTRAPEMKAAMMLVESMTSKFEPRAFHDTYREHIMKVIERKAAGRPIAKHVKSAAPSTNVIDLMDVLKRSLAETKHRAPAKRASHPAKRRAHAS